MPNSSCFFNIYSHEWFGTRILAGTALSLSTCPGATIGWRGIAVGAHSKGGEIGGHQIQRLLGGHPHVEEIPSLEAHKAPSLLAFHRCIKMELFR